MSQFIGHKTVSPLTVIEGIEFISAGSSTSVCHDLCWNALSAGKADSLLHLSCGLRENIAS